MADIKLKLGGEMADAVFTDISGEIYRVYEFSEELLLNRWIRPPFSVTIDKPQWLNVSASGGHRVLDLDGVSHYIPCGWKRLYWKSKDYHFVK